MADPSHFSLEGRGLKLDTAADIEAHIAPLLSPSAASTITSITLAGNTLGVGAAQALAPHLSKLTSLHTANLADIFTSRLLSEIPPALDALLTALLPLPTLRTLNLSDNAFGLNTQAPLVAFLEKHTPLQHLILNNNGLGPDAGARVADALSRLAVAKKSASGPAAPLLETVVCGRNRLENGSMAAWTRAIAAHAAGLREVKMVQNGIRQEGIQVLLREGLGRAAGLRVLDLQDNTFTAKGARALADVVGAWGQLRELGVGDCLLSARGGVLLGEALANGELQVLRLQYNEMDAKAVKSIVGAAKAGKVPKLRRVELNGNKFAEEDPSVEALRELLEERRDQADGEGDEEGEWGLDELSDLEEDSDEDEDEADDDGDDDHKDEETVEDKAETIVKQAEEAEAENVAQEKDDSVDDLADQLGKTGI